MNNLTLCQETRRECGISYRGTTPTPTTVVGQVGVLANIVAWVQQAWVDIQNLDPSWKFLRAIKVYSLTINQRTYNIVTDLALQNMREFDKRGCFIEEASLDKSKLTFEEWELFRERVIQTTAGRPQAFTVNPNGEIEFEVIPDKAYVVRLGYWMTAELLDDDADVPSFDEDFHPIIVWEAVMRYAGNNTASDLYQHAARKRMEILARMQVKYLVLPSYVAAQPPVGTR